jgi:hypothetical protein
LPVEPINLNLTLTWIRLVTTGQQPYRWGDRKVSRCDPNWNRSDLIYRWVRSSDREEAYIGISKNRTLTARISSYINGKSWPKDSPNHRVYDEQLLLSQINDFLFLEIVDQVPGYDLSILRERLWAEALLIGYYKPYLQ